MHVGLCLTLRLHFGLHGCAPHANGLSLQPVLLFQARDYCVYGRAVLLILILQSPGAPICSALSAASWMHAVLAKRRLQPSNLHPGLQIITWQEVATATRLGASCLRKSLHVAALQYLLLKVLTAAQALAVPLHSALLLSAHCLQHK